MHDGYVYDVFLQFIVGADGAIGANYEHSTAEGPPIISLVDHAMAYMWVYVSRGVFVGVLWLYILEIFTFAITCKKTNYVLKIQSRQLSFLPATFIIFFNSKSEILDSLIYLFLLAINILIFLFLNVTNELAQQ